MRSFFQKRNELDNPFFIGEVVDNKDPNDNYRIKVRIQEIHNDKISDDQLPWAAKVGPSFLGVNGSYNNHSVPEIGSRVLILSIGNDLNSLVYLGILCKKEDSTPSGDKYDGTFGIYTANNEFIGVDKITKTLQLIYEGHINVDKIIDAEIKVSDKISVTCPKIYIKGDIDIEGNIKIKGNVDTEGNYTTKGDYKIEGKMDITGDVTSEAEVTASNVTLTGHTHQYVHCSGGESSIHPDNTATGQG